MSMRPDPDLEIAAWLVDEARDGAPDRLIAATRLRLESTHQRRAWWPARRVPLMLTTGRLLAGAAAIAVVALAGLVLFPRSNGVGGSGSTGSPNPTNSATPTTSPVASPSGSSGSSVGEIKAVDGVTRVTATWPNEWVNEGFVLIKNHAMPPAGMAVSIWTVENTFTDPCSLKQLEPAVGPTVDDLVTALSQITSTTATKPTSATIAGQDARFVEVVVDDVIECPPGKFNLWQAAPNDYRYLQSAGETNRLWVFDVAGERVVVDAEYQSGASSADLAELQAIVDSIQIAP